MRSEKEVREMVETLDGLVYAINDLGSKTLSDHVLPNVESFKKVLMWVLEETSGLS